MASPFKILLSLLITVNFDGCTVPKKVTPPLIAKDKSNDNEKRNTLFVFVGEKMGYQTLPYREGALDAAFKAKYRIIQRIYGNYLKDTIEFTVFDHRGTPDFLKFKNVLLFVSKFKGEYFHEKYQFNDVYMTKEGRWAGSYAGSDYGHSYNAQTKIKPEKINFIERVVYSTKIVYDSNQIFYIKYPEPYFKTAGDSAFAVYGNYVEDLFRLKKEGVLTARGLFGDKISKPN
jgi:hypothetical protein